MALKLATRYLNRLTMTSGTSTLQTKLHHDRQVLLNSQLIPNLFPKQMQIVSISSQISSSDQQRCQYKGCSCCKTQNHHLKSISQTRKYCSEVVSEEAEDEEAAEKDEGPAHNRQLDFRKGSPYRPVDVDTSIRYMESDAYAETYGDLPIWHHFRANHKYERPPRRTRETCVRGGVITTGNPCPICRDDHLVLDHQNVKLLKQFMAPSEEYTFDVQKTQICMKQYKKLLVAIEKALNVGLLENKALGFREYDYAEYYESVKEKVIPDEPRKDSYATKIIRAVMAETKS